MKTILEKIQGVKRFCFLNFLLLPEITIFITILDKPSSRVYPVPSRGHTNLIIGDFSHFFSKNQNEKEQFRLRVKYDKYEKILYSDFSLKDSEANRI